MMKPRWNGAGLLLLAAALLLCRFAAAEEPAAEAPGPVSFDADVRPILERRCQGCHQPAKAGGELVLTSWAALMAAGRGAGEDAVVVPGEPESSLLYLEILAEDGEAPSMPKEGEPLSTAQVELIRRWIAEGARDDTPASRGDRYSAENPPVYRKPPVLTALDYSPDGELLAVSGFHEVLLHRADGAGLAARLVGLSERIESLAFSPDGRHLAVSGGSPARRGEVQVWEVESRRLRVSVPVTFDTTFGVSWSPDGKLLAFGCADNSVRAIDAQTGEQVLFQGAHNDWVLGTAFSSDASHLVSVSRDRSMKLIQVETEQFIDNITSITPGALKGGLITVDRHPGQEFMLVGGADGVPKIMRIYREKDRKIGDDFNLVKQFQPLEGRIFSAEFNHDGSRFVAGSSHERSGEVRVYDSESQSGEPLWSLRVEGPVYAVAFSPDGGTVAAAGFDGNVRLIDAAGGAVRRAFVPVPLAARAF